MLDKESQMRNVGTSLSQATEGQQLTNRNEDQKCTQGGESKTAGSHIFLLMRLKVLMLEQDFV